jgi:hypothetical protein
MVLFFRGIPRQIFKMLKIGGHMNPKQILNHQRIRKIRDSFGFIQHRFLRDGFLSSLEKDEIALYLFWILAADRYGLSFYGDERICKTLRLSPMELQETRKALIRKDLICWEDPLVQVLELPVKPASLSLPPAKSQSFKGLLQMLDS